MPASRRVRFDGRWHETPVYRRGSLLPAAKVPGPAIIAQLDTTLVLDPGSTATVDSSGNLVVEVGG